jgi:hypothetical protein
MKIDIKTNFPEVQRAMVSKGKQVRFATAVALTRTAQDVRTEEKAEIKSSFDRPTRYTENSLFLSPAKKDNLTAMVWIKDDTAGGGGNPATDYLLPEIQGGPRGLKKFERMLVREGFMAPTERTVPGAGARLDGYGNMSRGQLVQILSQLRAFRTVGGTSQNMSNSRRSKAKRVAQRYFVSRGPGVTSRGFRSWWNEGKGRSQHLAKGVWVQVGDQIKPVLMFVPHVNYRVRFAFFKVADRVIRKRFEHHFYVEYSKALRSAR